MKKVVIYGSGSFAETAYCYFKDFNLANVAGFVVEKQYFIQKKLLGLPVVVYDNLSETYPPDQYKVFVALGAHKLNEARTKYYAKIKAKGYEFANCISPNVKFFPDTPIGENVFISNACGFAPFVRIGNNVDLIGSKIGHHSIIKDNVLIASSTIGAKVICEENVFIGMGSTIVSNIRIGEKSIIGAGSLIKHDVEPFSVYSPDSKTVKREINFKKLKLG